MLSNILWSDWVPTLFINFNASIILAKKIVPMLMEVFELFICWLVSINKVISLGPFISLEIISMVNERLHCSLNNHNWFNLSNLVSMNRYINFVEIKMLNGQKLFLTFMRIVRKSAAHLWFFIDRILNFSVLGFFFMVILKMHLESLNKRLLL